MIIDADTHVLETEKTFSYLTADEQKYRPAIVRAADGTQGGIAVNQHGAEMWVIDGQLFGKHDLDMIAKRSNGQVVPGVLDLSDPAARIAAMDKQGVDVAVIYPSLFLATTISDNDAEVALTRSYNRWLAEICDAHPKRFKFVMLICPRRIDQAIADMTWAKDHGACGVQLRGFEGDATPDQTDYHPLFAKACDLNMPICAHIGHGSKAFRSLKFGAERKVDPFAIRVPTLIAFSAIIRSDLHKKFPALRWAFVEAGSSWLPAVSVMALRARRSADKPAAVRQALAEHKIYVTCEDHEDFPHILPYAGDDNLVIGSDLGHLGDVSESIQVQRDFKARPDVPERTKQRILSDNARVLYGL